MNTTRRTSPIGAVFPAQASPELLPAFAARAEELDYDELWVVEDCFLSGGLTLAATALAVTSQLRVGIGLLPAAVRNSAITAMEIATLARIHPGRLSVAFGHGVDAWMRQIGARPPRRVGALGEVVTAVRALLAGETITTDGDFVKLSDVTLDFPPSVAPEILIGTTGPAGIRLAGRHSDGVLLAEGCCPQFIADTKLVLAELGSPGGKLPEIVAYAWLRIGSDAGGRELLTKKIAEWGASGLFPDPIDTVGASGGSAADLIDELSVAGDADSCAAAVARFRDAGADRLVLAAVGADWEDQYLRFAREVLPGARVASVSSGA
jgi:5,10-methylenetetrahydromethanopterin reductase